MGWLPVVSHDPLRSVQEVTPARSNAVRRVYLICADSKRMFGWVKIFLYMCKCWCSILSYSERQEEGGRLWVRIPCGDTKDVCPACCGHLFGSADCSWTNWPSLKKKKREREVKSVLEEWNFILPTFVSCVWTHCGPFECRFILLPNWPFAGWSWYDVTSTNSWLKWLYCDDLTDSNNYVVMPEFQEHSGKSSGLLVVVVTRVSFALVF